MSSQIEQKTVQILWTLVRYGGDYHNDTEIVKIKNIKIEEKDAKGEVTRTKFEPKTLTDYDSKKYYRVKSSKQTKSGKKEPFWALIGQLAATKEDLEEKQQTDRRPKRNTFSRVVPPSSGPEDSTACEGSIPTKAENIVQTKKKFRKQIQSNKRQAEEEDYENYFANTGLEEQDRMIELEADIAAQERDLTSKYAGNIVHEETIEKHDRSNKCEVDEGGITITGATNMESVKSSINSLLDIVKGLSTQMSELKQKVENIEQRNNAVEAKVDTFSKSQSKDAYIQDWIYNVSRVSEFDYSIYENCLNR